MNSHVRMEQSYILFVILFIRLGLRIYMRGFEMLCYAIVTLCYAMLRYVDGPEPYILFAY